MKYYMYVAVRRDLSFPQQVVQATHAAIEASKRYHFSPLHHPSVVILGVKSEEALDNFANYVHSKNLHYETFKEPNRNHESTAVAVFPVSADQKPLFRKYQLLK